MKRANVESVDAIMEALNPALEADATRVRESLTTTAACAHLSHAERNVLRLVGLGLSNGEISSALCINISTVRCHMKRLHDKCYVRGRTRLAVAAFAYFAGGSHAG